jgi:hypothetical protein
MKQRKLASTLAVTLSLELILSPVIPNAHAQEPAPAPVTPTAVGRGPEMRAADRVNSSALGVATAIQAVGQIWQQGTQGMNQGMNVQMTGDMQKLREQMTPQPDKYFNPQRLMQIPGLANYLALNNINPATLDCKSLPTTLHEAKPEVCRVGISNDKGIPPQAQMSQMYGYYNQYFQINKMYKNFMADSNAEGQSFGVGCMNNAMNVLNGFFKYRLDELDKLTTNLEAMQDQFKKASRTDLDAIEEATAVLDGDSEISDKVRSRKPDLFDFGKRFNNPACNSMFAGNKLNDIGREGGLNSIAKGLKETMTEKNGKYSGESYSKSHMAIVEDIDGLADKVSKQLELNFSVLSKDPASYGKFLADLPDLVTSPNNTNRALSPDLFSDVRTKFNDSFIKLNEQKSTVLNELRSASISGEGAASLLGNVTSTNFESEIVSIENRLKNKCFESTLADIDRDKLMDKIYDPTASGHANRFASNFLKDKLNKILNNKDSSLDKKLAELKSLEAQNGGRYYMKMENSYEVQEVDTNGNLKSTVVGASTVRTPSVFFTDLIKNCNAQFRANKLDKNLSGATAIQKLRQLNQDFKNLAKSQAADMRKEVRRKLIECNNPEDANNTVPGSCTPERFNTSAPGFCANAAFTCSKNMQACNQQAEAFVKETKEQRTARVNNYKNLVEKNKNDIVKMFDTALSQYMRDAEILRGQFGAGFTSPAGIKREVEGDRKYLGEFIQATGRSQDGKLLLEDPQAFTEMFKNNITLLKESVRKQQDQILGGDSTGMGKNTPGLLAQHIKKTEANYKMVASESDNLARECIGKHDAAVQATEQQRNRQMEEYQKRMTQLGEKRNEFCNRLSMLSIDEVGACENFGNLGRDVLGAVNTEDARRTVGQFSLICRRHNNTNNNTQPSSIEFAEACIANGFNYPTQPTTTTTTSSTTSTGQTETDQSRTANPGDPAILRACENIYNKCGNSTTSSVTNSQSTETPRVAVEVTTCMPDFKQLVISQHQKNLQTQRQAGVTLTPNDIDAGAICGSSDNSTNRFSKAIQTFGEAAAQTNNPGAVGR